MRLGPERGRDRVGGVEPPAACPAAEPVLHHLDHVAEHRGLVVVELDELAVALEHRVVAVGGALEPARGGRPGAAVQRGLERREPPADVVEHAVEDQPQPALVGRRHQRVEVGLVAQPGVDPEVVGGVVPVALRREDRPEQQAVAAELDGVVQPRLELPQPVPGGLAVGQGRSLRAGEAERIHLPQNGVITPGRHSVNGTGSAGLPGGFSPARRLNAGYRPAASASAIAVTAARVARRRRALTGSGQLGGFTRTDRLRWGKELMIG